VPIAAVSNTRAARRPPNSDAVALGPATEIGDGARVAVHLVPGRRHGLRTGLSMPHPRRDRTMQHGVQRDPDRSGPDRRGRRRPFDGMQGILASA